MKNWLFRAFRWLFRAFVALALLVGVVYMATEVYHIGGVDIPEDQTIPASRTEHPPQNWKEGWGLDGTQWFHHANQGTKILPYAWFMALEQPDLSPFRARARFVDGDYLYRFGFLPSDKDDRMNPDGLPIGFAKQDDFIDPTAPAKGAFKVVGLTCAACHTGEIHYRDATTNVLKAVRIEGGAAMINLALFQRAVGLALFYTDFFEARYNRFANRVLGNKKNDQDERNRLRAEVKAFLDTNMSAQAYAEKKGLYMMDLGFARTDALGLIGNRVFGPLDQENLTVANAPVNFPQLWDTAWFDWVQYNASIRMPLVRNIGEALGVGGVVKLDVKKSDRFPSSVNVENLHHMESQLGGDKPYAGLWSPKWSDTGLPPIDTQKRNRGETLYRKYCQSCHLPPPKELEAEVNSKDSQNWHDERGEGGKEDQKIRVLTVKVSDLQVIGTDPNQALNFYRRLARVGGNTVPAAKGLYNVTGFIRNKFFDSKGILSNVDGPKEKERLEYDRNRPFDDPLIDKGDFDFDREAIISGVIVPRLGYKARPLNGIWATAPFLHNGSVPSFYQLLLPVDARDKKFYLGSKLFDPTVVGYNTDRLPGGFELDTQISGNTNVGHEFRNLELDEMELAVKGSATPPNNLRSGDERWANLIGLSVPDWKASSPEQQWAKQRDLTWKVVEEREDREIPKGVIGPSLSDLERWDLVEFLKSL